MTHPALAEHIYKYGVAHAGVANRSFVNPKDCIIEVCRAFGRNLQKVRHLGYTRCHTFRTQYAKLG